MGVAPDSPPVQHVSDRSLSFLSDRPDKRAALSIRALRRSSPTR
jgi:hypothetical protein